MKLTSTADPVIRIGAAPETNFKIKRTAKAFKVLSSSLYKDKIGAIVRELSTNAYDAHLMLNRGDRPFEIHLPKELAAYFGIRDFGPGISHEGMQELYTTYFESDKTDTNLLIGGFGLGSKSPFSYTKTFVVISRFEGMKRTYDCFIDSDGMPAISCRHAEPTTEESGLEVIVPVHRTADFHEFANRAKTNYLHYPVPPIVVSHDDFEFRQRPTPILSGEGFSVSRAEYRHHNQSQAKIVMGVVSYPLSAQGLMGSKLDQLDETTPLFLAMHGMRYGHRFTGSGWGTISGKVEISPEERQEIALLAMCNLPIEIHMPVGSIEVVAGREDISYEEETIDVLRAKLGEVRAAILTSVEKEFRECKTTLDAHKKFHSLFSDNTLTPIMAGQPEIKWRGKKITSQNQKVAYDDLPNVEVFKYFDDPYNHDKPIYERLKRPDKTRQDHDDYYEYDHHSRPGTLSFPATQSDTVEFFWRDYAEKACHQRIHRYKEILREAGIEKEVYVFQTKDQNERDKIAKRLDGYAIRHVNDLPEVEESYRPPTRAPLQVLKVENVGLGEPIQTCYYNGWQQVTVNLDLGGVYVTTDHQKIVRGKTPAQAQFSDLFNAIRYLGLVDDGGMPPIYAIPKTEMHRIEGNNNWVSAWDYLIPRLKAHLDDNPVVAKKAAFARSRNLIADTRSDIVGMMKLFENVAALLSPDHELGAFVREYSAQSKVGKVYDHIHRAIDECHIKIKEPAITPLATHWDTLTKSYPLFKLVLSTTVDYTKDSESAREFARYVNAVDAYEDRPQQEIAA